MLHSRITIKILRCLLVLSVTILGIFSYWAVRSSSQDALKLQHLLLKKSTYSDLRLEITGIVMPSNDYLITGNKYERTIYKERNIKVWSLLEQAELIADSEEERALIKKAKEEHTRISKMALEILDLENPIANTQGAAMMENMDRLQEMLVYELDHLNNLIKISEEATVKEINFRRVGMLGAILVFSLLTILLALGIARISKNNENRLQHITSSLGDGIVVIDHSGRVTFTNPEALSLLGITDTEDATGQVHKYFPRRVLQLTPSANLREEIVITRTDNSKIKLSCLATPFVEETGVGGVVVALRDISESREVAKDLVRLDQLNLIGEMAAGIGHEVRNPLTTAIGFLQLLSEKKDAQHNLEYYNVIISELKRANSIITEFLTLAKDKRSELRKINLNEILNNIHAFLLADAFMTDKRLILELDKVPDIFLDAKEIKQVILNLVKNGFEAMEQGGVLKVSTYLVKDEVVLEVTDQGEGIAPEVLKKLGTPFFTTKDQGTGLGLAICYSVAKRHNARVVIDSGKAGTSVQIYFPTSGSLQSAG